MPSTSSVYLAMHRRRAAKLVAERIDGVSVDDDDGSVAVRLDGDVTWVATIEGADSPPDADAESNLPAVQVEYATDGSARAQQKATQVRRLLSLRAR